MSSGIIHLFYSLHIFFFVLELTVLPYYIGLTRTSMSDLHLSRRKRGLPDSKIDVQRMRQKYRLVSQFPDDKSLQKIKQELESFSQYYALASNYDIQTTLTVKRNATVITQYTTSLGKEQFTKNVNRGFIPCKKRQQQVDAYGQIYNSWTFYEFCNRPGRGMVRTVLQLEYGLPERLSFISENDHNMSYTEYILDLRTRAVFSETTIPQGDYNQHSWRTPLETSPSECKSLLQWVRHTVQELSNLGVILTNPTFKGYPKMLYIRRKDEWVNDATGNAIDFDTIGALQYSEFVYTN